jgi:hypothetical protein
VPDAPGTSTLQARRPSQPQSPGHPGSGGVRAAADSKSSPLHSLLFVHLPILTKSMKNFVPARENNSSLIFRPVCFCKLQLNGRIEAITYFSSNELYLG